MAFSLRFVSSQLRRQALAQGFRTAAPTNAASSFTMPAMSPTMTEGSISSWKVKEGDTFTTGDVLLEIETDKAQMDVEAQDDGIVAKIVVPSGTKNVKVGTRVAVLAEEGDDIASLEIPAEESSAPEAKADKFPAKQERHAEGPPKASESPAKSTPDTQTTRPPQHPSPSVMHLLKTHNIRDAASIKGTGPKGRLLKGDILAHLSKIPRSAPTDVESRINALAHLDLSNIKIRPSKPEPAAAAAPPAPPKDAEVSLTISFTEVAKIQQRMQATLGVFPPLSTFIEKATRQANASVPEPQDLFDQVLGLPASKPVPASFAPKIAPVFPAEEKAFEMDIIDILSGRANAYPKPVQPREGIMGNGENVLSLKVPIKEEERARRFLGTVKGLLEESPGSLVL